MEFVIIVIVITVVALWISSLTRKAPTTGTEAVLTSMALSEGVDPRSMTEDEFAVWLGSQYVPSVLEMYRDLLPTQYPEVSAPMMDLLSRRILYLQGHRSDVVDLSEEAMQEDAFWRELEARADRESPS